MNNVNHPTDEDSDLQDLLGTESTESSSNNPASATASASTPSSQKFSSYYTQQPNSRSFLLFRIPELFCYYITSFFLYNPVCGKIVTLSLLLSLLYALLNISVFHKSQSIGIIKYDFNSIKSELDFDIGKVDHWCIQGGDECQCPDPLHPTPRMHKAWHKAVQRHRHIVNAIANHGSTSSSENEGNKSEGLPSGKTPDVVFLGQSLVEVMNGRINGADMSEIEYFGKVKHTFHKQFANCTSNSNSDSNSDSCVNGLAMGLTGDSSSNVLWRLMHGELPPDFDPPIWWLVVGMEDLGKYACSEEITIMGILRVVEEIMKRRPNAKIIINSLLPMTKMRVMQISDRGEFIDAEREHGKGPHRNERHHDHGDGEDSQMQNKWKKNSGKKREKGTNKWKKGRNNDNRMLRKRQFKHAQQEDYEANTEIQKPEDGETDDRKRRPKFSKSREVDIERIQKKYEKQVQHDKYNPTMKVVHKFHKKNGKDKTGIPMWSAIYEINKSLHNFSRKTHQVAFFDATELFTEKTDGGDYTLLTDLISPRGHPTAYGFKKWHNAMHDKVVELKKKMKNAEGDKQLWKLNSEEYYNNGGSPTTTADKDISAGNEDDNAVGSKDKEENVNGDKKENVNEDKEENANEDKEENVNEDKEENEEKKVEGGEENKDQKKDNVKEEDDDGEEDDDDAKKEDE